MKKTSRMRRVLRWIGIVLLVAIVLALVDGWRAFGHRATGERRARAEKSPQFRDGHFINPQPLVNDWLGSLTGYFGGSDHTRPPAQLTVVTPDPHLYATPPASGLRVTWFGHSSSLIEIDGIRVLTDPVWSERVGPVHFFGPSRWFAPPVALADLPPIDVVVISHDHYDHLDFKTIEAMRTWEKTRFVVPLGVGAHLEYWGISAAQIVETDWWERTPITSTVSIVTTPARHASGRALWDNDATLWAGYALIGDQHRVYFSGDTGPFPLMERIGKELGPFDLTMIECGQYHRAWPDWHGGPERAVWAHNTVGGRVLLPIHWGLFVLAYHGWTEPIERLLAAAGTANVITPAPGQPIEPTPSATTSPWWPRTITWRTAAEDPIAATGM